MTDEYLEQSGSPSEESKEQTVHDMFPLYFLMSKIFIYRDV